MSKKSFVVMLGLSIAITIVMPMLGFVTGNYAVSYGFPIKFTSFNFLGSSTDYLSFFFDIIFWFFVVFLLWRLLLQGKKR